MTQKTTLKPQVKTVAGKVFEFMAEVDEETGACLWTKAHQESFNAWLGEQWERQRDAFTVQGIQIPDGIDTLISDFLRRHPGGEEADVIRATVLVYLDVLRDPKQTKRIEEIFALPDYQGMLKGEPRKTKVRFKPTLFMDIEACASAFALKPSKVVSEALARIMACYFLSLKNKQEDFVRQIEARIESFLVSDF